MEVDYTSRHFNNRTERTLSYKIFRQITARYYTPQVDLFASTINNQLLRYVSRYPDPGSLATDAFLLDCSQWTVSIHPPMCREPFNVSVWPISRYISKQQGFQKKCAKLSWYHGEDVLRNGTRDHGNYCQAGVFQDRSVHFQLLLWIS